MSIFLIARQRSGTGALGSVLDRHHKLKYLGEILHPSDRDNPANFFSYLESESIAASFALAPNTRPETVQSFFGMIRRLHPGKQAIYDIKYNSLHHWNGGWHGILQEPWIFRHAKNNLFPIIHLTRKNTVETFVSGRLAELNQVWHAQKREDIKTTRIRVEISQLIRYLHSATREIDQIKRWLKPYDRHIEVEYADTFTAEGRMKEDIASQLSVFLGIDEFLDLSPAFVKQAPTRLSESIENFEDVYHALKDTPFADMVKQD